MGFFADVEAMQEKEGNVIMEEVQKEVIEERKPKEKEVDRKIPYNYHEITLSSCGRLSTPYKIHVRDYYTQDALGIAQSTKVLKEILNFLEDGIFENIDPYKLHQKELEEIMLNLYSAFWNPKIEGYYYPAMLTQEELQAEIDEYNEIRNLGNLDESKHIKKSFEDFSDEIFYVSIDLKKVNMKPIAADFKEPIVCVSKEDGDMEVKLRLPRIGDVFFAEEYVEKLFAIQDQKYKNMDISEDHPEYEAYTNYEQTRNLELAIATTAQCIVAINGKDVSKSLLDQIEAYKKTIPRRFWKFCWDEIQRHTDSFGVDQDIEIVSPLTGKSNIRRCTFRLMDFIPSGQIPSFTGYASRYGD